MARMDREERREHRAAKSVERSERKAANAAEKAERERVELEKYGRQVALEVCAGRTVKIYEKGYVRVGVLGTGDFEKLLGISGASNAVSKTAVGRGLAFVATGGWSYMLTPKNRGKLQLTIITEKKTHKLSVQPPTDGDIKAMNALEAAGNAVLDMQARAESRAGGSSEPALPEQLAQLAALRDSGALSESEFAAAKSRLLGG